MSIVVAVVKQGRVAMAADTQSTFGSEAVPPDNLSTAKIRRVGPALLGRAGFGVYDNILEDLLREGEPPDLRDAPSIFRFFTELWKVLHKRYAFVNDQSKRKDSPFGDLGGSFIVANGAGIFFVASNLGVTRFLKYYAIGSGADYSLGALHQLYDRESDPTVIACRAAETATVFDVHCGGRIETLEVGAPGAGGAC
jgi:ATP-dependent protease HslVU (ClpYQ) peptidase subunit